MLRHKENIGINYNFVVRQKETEYILLWKVNTLIL